MKNRIAILLPDLGVGGAQKVMLILAEALVEKNLQVDLLVGISCGDFSVSLPRGVRLIGATSKKPLFGNLGLATSMFIEVYKYLKSERPDAILSTLTGTNIVAATAHKLSGSSSRLVLREASSFKNLRSNFYLFLMKFVYKRATSVVVLTKEMKSDVISKLQLNANNVHQINNPLNLKKIIALSEEELPNNFNHERPYVLAVGRLVKAKNYELLIKSFCHCAKKTLLNLVVIGEGEERRNIERLIKSLNLESRVFLRGYDSNPYRWMRKAKLFVLTSSWEGYPNVLVEAQALGLPVVATNYCSSVYNIVQSPGQVVSKEDNNQLSQAVIDIYNNHPKKNSISISEHEKIIEANKILINNYIDLLVN